MVWTRSEPVAVKPHLSNRIECTDRVRQLQDAVEPVAWLSMTAGQWAIEEAEFCFYAAFSQADVRLRANRGAQRTSFNTDMCAGHE